MDASTPRKGTDGHSSRRLLSKGVRGVGIRGRSYTCERGSMAKSTRGTRTGCEEAGAESSGKGESRMRVWEGAQGFRSGEGGKHAR